MKTLLVFGASWCAPCRQQKKLLQGLDLGVEVAYKDVETDCQDALQYHVRSVPTLLLVENGRVLWQRTGYTDAGTLREALT